MSPLEQRIARATERFAKELLAIFRSAVLGDIVPPSKTVEREGKPPRPPRMGGRKGARIDYDVVATEILTALKKGTELSSEALQKATGREKREVFPTLRRLLASNAIRKTGQKRGTRYFVR